MKERRYLPESIEIRSTEDDQRRIVGYAAIFDTLSEDLGGFREKIAPGAFDEALNVSDTRALFNHNSNYVLGRKSSGTLMLKVDDRGLHYEIVPPETAWANDLITSIERGDINQSSFGFIVAVDGDDWQKVDGEVIRTVNKIRELPDISPVTFPAYPQTEAQARAVMEEAEKRHLIPDSATTEQEKDTDAATRESKQRVVEFIKLTQEK